MSLDDTMDESGMIDVVKANGHALDSKAKKFWEVINREMTGWEDTAIKVDPPSAYERPPECQPDIHPTHPPDVHIEPPESPQGRALKAMLDAGMTYDDAARIVSLAGETSTRQVCDPVPAPTTDSMAKNRREWDRKYRRDRRAKERAAKEAAKASTQPSTRPADTQNRDTLKEIKIDTEEEVKERKKVRTSIVYSKDFDNFWLAYPRTPSMGKFEAYTVWKRIGPEERELAAAAVPKFAAWVKTQKPDYVILHACRFLSKKRFEGFQTEPQSKLGRLDIPPWEREGLSESEYWDKERARNAQG